MTLFYSHFKIKTLPVAMLWSLAANSFGIEKYSIRLFEDGASDSCGFMFSENEIVIPSPRFVDTENLFGVLRNNKSAPLQGQNSQFIRNPLFLKSLERYFTVSLERKKSTIGKLFFESDKKSFGLEFPTYEQDLIEAFTKEISARINRLKRELEIASVGWSEGNIMGMVVDLSLRFAALEKYLKHLQDESFNARYFKDPDEFLKIIGEGGLYSTGHMFWEEELQSIPDAMQLVPVVHPVLLDGQYIYEGIVPFQIFQVEKQPGVLSLLSFDAMWEQILAFKVLAKDYAQTGSRWSLSMTRKNPSLRDFFAYSSEWVKGNAVSTEVMSRFLWYLALRNVTSLQKHFIQKIGEFGEGKISQDSRDLLSEMIFFLVEDHPDIFDGQSTPREIVLLKENMRQLVYDFLLRVPPVPKDKKHPDSEDAENHPTSSWWDDDSDFESGAAAF